MREGPSPKISRAKALVRFSRYEPPTAGGSGGKLDFDRLKQGVGLLPRFVSDAGWKRAKSRR